VMVPGEMAPEAVEDLRRLDRRSQYVALQWLSRLRREPFLGHTVQWRHGERESRVRVLYFTPEDEPLRQSLRAGDKPSPQRIVYELLPREEAPTNVHIVAIVPREPNLKRQRDAT